MGRPGGGQSRTQCRRGGAQCRPDRRTYDIDGDGFAVDHDDAVPVEHGHDVQHEQFQFEQLDAGHARGLAPAERAGRLDAGQAGFHRIRVGERWWRYVQYFQNGWAMIPSAGKGGSTIGSGGIVTGPALSYFQSHGTVTNVGWPSGNAQAVSGGSWQDFTSNGNAYRGAISTGSAGTFTVKGAIYDYYRANSLSGVFGAATSETPYAMPGFAAHPWGSHGGGYAQYFTGGLVAVANSGAKGSVQNPLLSHLDIAGKGWPTSNTFTGYGALRVNQESGYATNGPSCAPTTPPVKPSPGYTLTSGWNGVKVYLAQQALGLSYAPDSTVMGPQTQAAIRAFQQKHGLPVTGNLDESTFTALNTGYVFTVDSWKEPALVSAGASQSARGNAAASFARQQKGKPYIWGGTGPMGYDCAGLVLQALRAGGFDPKNVSNYFDIYPTSDLSNKMWLDTSEFHRISSSAVQPGDLVFWGYGGKVHHVAMYLGNGQWIQALDRGQGVYISSGGIAGAQAQNGYGSSNLFGYARGIQ